MDPYRLLLAVTGGSSMLLLVVGTLGAWQGNDVVVRSRLAALGESLTRASAAASAHQPSFVSASLAQLTQRLERVIGGRWHRELARAGYAMEVAQAVRLRVGCIALAAIVIPIGTQLFAPFVPPLLAAGIGAVLGWGLPMAHLRLRMRRRTAQIEDQMVELCESMSTLLASGFGYQQALHVAATQVGAPLEEELRRFMDSVRVGAEFEEALRETAARLASADFDVVATALEVQRRTGGNLADVLRGVGITIRERQTFRREIASLTSRERYSSLIVAGFPLVLVGVLTALLPDVFGRLFVDPIGHLILVAALAMDAMGYLVARRLTALEL